MKYALIIAVLVIIGLICYTRELTVELRAEQVKVLERELDREGLYMALLDRAGDADRERMYKADVAALKAEIAALKTGSTLSRTLTTEEQLQADLNLIRAKGE